MGKKIKDKRSLKSQLRQEIADKIVSGKDSKWVSQIKKKFPNLYKEALLFAKNRQGEELPPSPEQKSPETFKYFEKIFQNPEIQSNAGKIELFHFARLWVDGKLTPHAKALIKKYPTLREDTLWGNPEDNFIGKVYTEVIDKIRRGWESVPEYLIPTDIEAKKVARNYKVGSRLSYIKGIMTNMAKEMSRNRKEAPVSLDKVSIISPIRLGKELERKLDEKRNLELIKKNLPKLKKEYQDIIRWSFFEEKSDDWIAKKMGKTKNNIYVLKNRALKSLKSRIKNQ
jgi:RNA polymerase sigma factor (sigma-70 family)